MNNARKYIAAVLFDNIGSSLTAFILPLFVLDISGSGLHLSIIGMLNRLPFLFLGLPIGALIDTLNLKKILNYSDAIRAVLYLFLSIICFATKEKAVLIISIYILTCITSCVNVFNNIAEITFIPEIVEERDFAKMNSIIFGLQYVTGLIVPLVGGYLYRFEIVPYILLVNSITYIFSVFLITKINYFYHKIKNNYSLKEKISSVYSDLADGIQYVIRNSKVGLPLFAVAIFNFITANFENNVITLFKVNKGYSAAAIGSLLMISSLGALIGSLVCTKLSKKYTFKKLLLLNFCLHVFFRIAFLIFGNVSGYAISMLGIYMLDSILNILVITFRQTIVDKKYLGRINSIYKTVLIGMSSLGLLYGGMLTSILGVQNSLVFSTITLIVFTLIIVPLLYIRLLQK